jgi:hypothetical protein
MGFSKRDVLRAPIPAHVARVWSEVPRVRCKGHCQHSCKTWSCSQQERALIESVTGPLKAEGPTCPLLSKEGECTVYRIRPLICRAWGALPSLPCPHGCKVEGGYLPEADFLQLHLELAMSEPMFTPWVVTACQTCGTSLPERDQRAGWANCEPCRMQHVATVSRMMRDEERSLTRITKQSPSPKR